MGRGGGWEGEVGMGGGVGRGDGDGKGEAGEWKGETEMFLFMLIRKPWRGGWEVGMRVEGGWGVLGN